jgi:hypothetical protein
VAQAGDLRGADDDEDRLAVRDRITDPRHRRFDEAVLASVQQGLVAEAAGRPVRDALCEGCHSFPRRGRGSVLPERPMLAR